MRDDAVWCFHEIVPCLAASLDDGVVGFIDTNGEFVLSQILPDVFGGVDFGGEGRLGYEGEIGWCDEGLAAMPAGAIEDDDAMCAGCDAGGDHGEMLVHRRGVGVGHDDGGAGGAGWADGAEEIDPLVAGVPGFARTRAFAGPDTGERAFLADPGFVLKPDFEGLVQGFGRQRRCHRRGEVLWNGPPLFPVM